MPAGQPQGISSCLPVNFRAAEQLIFLWGLREQRSRCCAASGHAVDAVRSHSVRVATVRITKRFNNMSEAQRFRDRAVDCRALAQGARTQADKVVLEELAAELDAEAERIEAEETAQTSS